MKNRQSVWHRMRFSRLTSFSTERWSTVFFAGVPHIQIPTVQNYGRSRSMSHLFVIRPPVRFRKILISFASWTSMNPTALHLPISNLESTKVNGDHYDGWSTREPNSVQSSYHQLGQSSIQASGPPAHHVIYLQCVVNSVLIWTFRAVSLLFFRRVDSAK